MTQEQRDEQSTVKTIKKKEISHNHKSSIRELESSRVT